MATFPLMIIGWILMSTGISHGQFLIPVSKDASSEQYITRISYGTPLVETKLVVDLGGPFMWVDCASRSTPSSSSLITPQRSLQCFTAKTQKFVSSPVVDQPCQVFPENSITGIVGSEGELVEDLMSLQSSQGGQVVEYKSRFSCSSTTLLHGLAKGSRGMVGLGRSRTSLPSQVFDNLITQRKLTLCLSSSKFNGFLLLGNHSDILKSLTFTPLLTGFPSHEYFINVNSIKINGKRLSLPFHIYTSGIGGLTLLSTIVPYTTMHTSIYNSFNTAFEDAALAMNMTRVASVPPFQLCYSSRGASAVPVIDFVLQSDMVKWTIHPRNSMVRITDQVMCLGFLDGGLNPTNSIVIGGYQLEDVIVQFDLATSMLGFSTTKNTNCSHFNFKFPTAHSI